MSIINFILHLDKYLNLVIQNYGLITYLILFTILFCETGLVVTPFLPGDSLLFTAGALSSLGSLNIAILFAIFATAAVVGDTVNYFIGKSAGNEVLKRDDIKLIKKEHLKKAEEFYNKYGGITILLSRFIPVIRTFTPFVAGIGKMEYSKFVSYNVAGGLLWTGLFLFGGYYFGNLPFVKQNFSFFIFAIIFLSIIPAAIELIKRKPTNV